MADFEPPSFSLGLDDFDLFDSEPQTNDDEFQTLVVDDSEPDYPNSHPIAATSSSSPVKTEELHSKAVIEDQHLHTQHCAVSTSSNDQEPVSASCNNAEFPKLTASHLRGFHLTDDSDSYDPVVSWKCSGSDLNSNLRKFDDLPQHFSNAVEDKDFPKAYRYFFHDDPRIQELVQSRLPNFLPLGNMLNIELEQPGTSKIDYMGQFSFGESSKQAARTIKDKKRSTCRNHSRKLKNEEMSQGWVNPKLGVTSVTTKGAVKRKAHTARRTVGHWLTDLDGKKVYVGKSGQELTGRVAYMQYKKETGSGFKKRERKSATKKKK